MPRPRRYAIISDIHANIEALDAVLADAKAQGVDDIVCLGDVVGYNAAPSQCIRRVRELGCKVVKGNHDHYCSDPSVNLDDFQPNAASVIEWTRRNISEDDTRWLSELPFTATLMGFTIVHSTLDSPEHFRYAFDTLDAADSFNCQRTRVCFHGHTNVGSVGQPRDGDPRACYLIYTTEGLTKLSIEFRRVDYDIESAVRRIEEAGLPGRLITRLYTGQ